MTATSAPRVPKPPPCQTCGKIHRTEAAADRCAAGAERRASTTRKKWKRAHDAVGDWCRRRDNLAMQPGGLRSVIREKRWQWGKKFYDVTPPRTFQQVANDLNRDFPLRDGRKWEAIDVVEASNAWLNWPVW